MADHVGIRSWSRLEPRAQTADPGVGLPASVADPLWFLARQWQLAEFVGDDGATPVRARVRVGWTPLTRWAPGPLPDPGGPIDARPFEPLVTPLEALVEAEPATTSLAVAAEAGLRLARLLRAAGVPAAVAALLAAFPLAAGDPPPADDEANLGLATLLAGRSIDGVACRRAVAAAGGVPPEAGVTDGDREATAAVLADWVDWFDRRWPGASPGADAWNAERLEYSFSVAAPMAGGGELVLHAPEYHGGGLDWFDLDVAPGATLGADADAAHLPGVPIVRTVLPRPVAWPGAPSDRFWEMEDASVHLGRLDAWPTDLATMLAVEFSLVDSADWFSVPLQLPVGCVAWVESAVVEDTFGERTLVRAGAGEVGRLFQPAVVGRPDGDHPALVLAPTLVAGLESAPVEEVLFLRDQLANLAWAVERSAEGRAGLAVDVAAALARRQPPGDRATAPVPGGEADVRYRLATAVPDNWKPLTPKLRTDGDRRSNRLVRAELTTSARPEPFTRMVAEITELFEEEVPREGARVRRTRQLARWVDGSTWCWSGRAKQAGRGEGSSGLRFDTIEPG